MATTAKRLKLVTPEFIGSYVHLDQPYSGSDDIDPCYSILIVLDPDDKEHAKFIDKVEDAIQECIENKWGDKPRKFQSPLREGEDVGESEELQGKLCINVRSKTRPGIVDADSQKILDVEQECYSGAIYRCSISAYAWEHKVGGKGVSFGLDNVMKVDDGEHLGGGRSAPEEDFADVRPSRRSSKKAEAPARSKKSRVVEEEDDEEEEKPTRRRRNR